MDGNKNELKVSSAEDKLNENQNYKDLEEEQEEQSEKGKLEVFW